MNWYLKVLKNYATFSGRARRKEFWMFTLINFVIAVICMAIDRALGTTITMGLMPLPYGYVYLAYGLAVFIPSLAVAVRRLHDINKSGWFLFIAFLPIVGAIWLLVLDCTAGTVGGNEYGPDPKEEDGTVTQAAV